MKLIRLFLTLLLLGTAESAFSMHIHYAAEAVKTPAQRAQEATQELQKMEFFEYIKQRKAAKIKELVREGANPNIPNVDGDYVLIFAANKHWIDVVNLLLAKKANLNVQDREGNTALLGTLNRSSSIGQPGYDQRKKQIIETLLAHGANPDLRNNYGNSPLSSAISSNKPAFVKLLLDYGADPFKTNLAGLSDLQLGLQSNNPEIVKLFTIQKLP